METKTVLVQTSDWCWGKGPDLAEAIKQCRNQGSRITRTGRKVDYIVFEFDANVKPESVFVDGMGSSRWEVHTPDEAAGFSQGLIKQWIHTDGKDGELDS